jgi:hypothetical protein
VFTKRVKIKLFLARAFRSVDLVFNLDSYVDNFGKKPVFCDD